MSKTASVRLIPLSQYSSSPGIHTPPVNPEVENLCLTLGEALRREESGASKDTVLKLRKSLHDLGFTCEETRRWMNELSKPYGEQTVRELLSSRLAALKTSENPN